MQSVDYKAIARRFRPKTFSEVTGQDFVVTTLKHAILQKRASHAYLFCGIRGTGKTTLARLFAKGLNCAKPTEEGEPCNECDSCKEISENRSLDIIEIDGASNRGIDDIRNINDTLGYATFQGRFKIFIIDEVHMLTKEAFNALLKSLEEPPKNVKFFLATTEAQKVLPTIVSRCQRFDLSRIRPAEMIRKLRSIAKELKVEVEDEALSLISRLSDGSLRDAESLFDQICCQGERPITTELIAKSIGLVAKEHFFALDEAYRDGDIGFAFSLSQELFSGGKDVGFLIESLLEHYRSIALLLLKKSDIETAFFDEMERDGYSRAMSIYELPQVLYLLDYLTDLYTSSNKTTFKKIHLEMTLLRIIQSKSRITIEQIVSRLHELEGKAVKEEASPPVKSTSLADELMEVAAKSAPIEKVKKEEPKIWQKTKEEALIQKEALIQDEDVVEEESLIEEEVSSPLEEVLTHSDSAKQETLMRFAQVELGGTLKKNI